MARPTLGIASITEAVGMQGFFDFDHRMSEKGARQKLRDISWNGGLA